MKRKLGELSPPVVKIKIIHVQNDYIVCYYFKLYAYLFISTLSSEVSFTDLTRSLWSTIQ